MTSKSQAIVSFIANLMPSYHPREASGVWCAESLDDGTIISPVLPEDEEHDDDDAWVRINWQGASERQSEVLGDTIATVAVVRHLQLHYAGQPLNRLAREMEGLSTHYRFKTGGALYLPYERAPAGLGPILQTAIVKIGEAGVIEVLKKAAGL